MKKLQVTTLLICLFAFTAINTNAQTQGPGNALSFDGVNDHLTVEHSASLNLTSEVTVELWIRPILFAGSHLSFRIIVNKGEENHSPTNSTYQLYYNHGNDNFEFKIGNGSNRREAIFPYTADEKWHHLCGTYDGQSVKIYFDGILKDETAQSGNIKTNNLQLFIGDDNNKRPFGGDMDELRIWNRALTETEIRNNMNKPLTGNEPGLVAYYQMNEGEDGTCEAGKDVCDKSGNGNHGTKK